MRRAGRHARRGRGAGRDRGRRAPPATAARRAAGAARRRRRATARRRRSPRRRHAPRLARELGVALEEVAGQRPARAHPARGRRARRGVARPRRRRGRPARRRRRGRARRRRTRRRRPPAPPSGAPARSCPLRGVRRTIAHALTRGAGSRSRASSTTARSTRPRSCAPRASLRQRAVDRGDEALAKALTPTPLVVRAAVLRALRDHPYVNASIDLEREEITLHGHYHVGIAAAGPDGLTVPVVHDADRRGRWPSSRARSSRSRGAARERRLRPEQLAGATFTVNNFGSLGDVAGHADRAPARGRQPRRRGDPRPRRRRRRRAGGAPDARRSSVAGDHRVLDGDTLAAFVDQVADAARGPVLLFEDLPLMVVGEFAEPSTCSSLGGGPGRLRRRHPRRPARPQGDARRARRARPGSAGSACTSAASRARRSSSWPTPRSARATCAPPGCSVDGVAVSLERFQALARRAVRRPRAAASAGCSTAGGVRVVHGEARFNRARPRRRCARPRTGVRFFEFEHAIVATGSRPVALPGPALRRRARAGLDRRAGADRGARQRRRRRRRLHRPRARHGAGQARRARDRRRGARPRPADRRASRSPRPCVERLRALGVDAAPEHDRAAARRTARSSSRARRRGHASRPSA